MAGCEVCGNECDEAFTVTAAGKTHTFDSLARVIAARRSRTGPEGS